MAHSPRVLGFVHILVLLAGDHWQAESYRALPQQLRHCYADNGSFVPTLPLSLQAVIDVIRKLEARSYSTIPLRNFATALLKRYRLDGIVYSERLPERAGVLRYAARGPQRAKHLLVERLVPGPGRAAIKLPEDGLTPDEICLLHFATSSTVWQRYEANEESFCRPGPTEKIYGEQSYRSIAAAADRCPKESGVVLTPFGTVALGPVLAAIAAALEPQLVKTRLLLELPNEEDGSTARSLDSEFDEEELKDDGEDVEFVAAKGPAVDSRSLWLQTVTITDTQIDNVWISTIAGELAELAIYQGPIYEERMYLGATGFWNSTIRPQVFYFSHHYDHFDATRAEIIGGIDGLIIAKNLEKWLKKHGSLRLSQILDMYYSEKGMISDRSVKACRRADHFPLIGPTAILEEQTYAAAQVLAYLNSVAAMSDAAVQRAASSAVQTFRSFADEHVFPEQLCRGRSPRPSRLELLLAFDGSWTPDYTADFIAALVGDFDVQLYGSRVGLIHGESGEWLVNVTNSLADAHRAINNLENIRWPRSMRLDLVFERILTHLDRAWEEKRKNKIIGDLGRAVVLLVPMIQLTEPELARALDVLKKLKAKHPEVHFLYYTCDSRAETLGKFLISDEDRIVKTMNVDDISKVLSKVPMTLRPVGCNPNILGVRLQLEDYVSPSESNVYRLHPQWRIKTKKVVVTLHGMGYGTLRVCWWNQDTEGSKRVGTYCKALPPREDITLTDYNACAQPSDNCLNTYIEISNVTSLGKCTEFACSSPDQVRYIMRMENFHCSMGVNVKASLTIFVVLLMLVRLLR